MKLYMKKESNMVVSPVVYQLLAWLLILTTLGNDIPIRGIIGEEILMIIAVLNNAGLEVKLLLESLKTAHILCRIGIVETEVLKDITNTLIYSIIYVLVIGREGV